MKVYESLRQDDLLPLRCLYRGQMDKELEGDDKNAIDNVCASARLGAEPRVYAISGKPSPLRTQSSNVAIAEISLSIARLEVAVLFDSGEWVRCGCDVWEHTVYEFESLAAAVRLASSGPFPPPYKVETPESYIGVSTDLLHATVLEVGCCLRNPRNDKARFLCSSRVLPLTWELAVRLGVILSLSTTLPVCHYIEHNFEKAKHCRLRCGHPRGALHHFTDLGDAFSRLLFRRFVELPPKPVACDRFDEKSFPFRKGLLASGAADRRWFALAAASEKFGPGLIRHSRRSRFGVRVLGE
jgi:hypothetical protein